MRKTYLFALLALVMVFAFSGFAFANDMKTAEQKAQDEESMRPTVPFQNVIPQGVNLDEQVILYETTFENANDWTIVDGGEGTTTWECISSANQTHDVPMFNTPPFMWVDSDDATATEHLIETLISPAMDASSYTYVYLVCDIEFLNVTIGRDSLEILFTNDDGTTWESIHVFSDDSRNYPGVFDISTLAAGEASFKIAFNYDDDDACMWYAGVDNFKVYGCDEVGDFEPPVIDLTSAPVSGFVGVDNREIVVTATDNVGIDQVVLSYGLLVNNNVPEILNLAMTATGNADEFAATIPVEYGAVGDTIAFLVTAADAAGNTAVAPPEAGNAYIFKINEFEEFYVIEELETYEWLEVSATGTDLDMGDSSIEEIAFADYDGFDSFTFYGVTYTSVFVNSNGWICFESGASAYTGRPGIYNTATPNSTIVMCGADLDADEIGDVYVGVVDGKFVIQWGDDTGGCQLYYADNGPKGQIVLDGETNTAYINYDTITGFTDEGEPYTEIHNMGIENPEGTIGQLIYQGAEFTYPTDETSFMIYKPVGGIEGVVTATEGGAALSEVSVTVYEGETEVGSAQTDDLGAYSVNVIDGTYSVVFAKAGYTVNTVNDVVVDDYDMTELNVTMDEETTTETLSGVVYSADTDNPIEGIVVKLVETEESVTTGADGAYSFADEAVGNYTIEINAELGLTTYHDLSADVTIAEGMDPVDFSVSMIMAPENLQPTVGNMTVTLTFDPPANHATPEMVQGRIDALELIVNLHDQNLKLADNIDEIREQLAMYRTIYANLTTTSSSLDEIADFVGYRVKQDDAILEDVYTTESIELTNLLNNQQYSFQVAADYGYGDEFLLFCDAVNATPDAGNEYWINTTVAYDWVEIRTNDLGTRVPWTADDRYSGMMEFAGGLPYYFFGIPYTEFNIGSNGFLSFTETASGTTTCPYTNAVIPTATAPNGFIAPHWDWTEISNDEAYSAYYHYDSENSQVIVTWYCPEWNTSDPENILEYQVILDLSNFNATFNYKSHTTNWPTSVTIGIENQDGTAGLQYDGIGEDEMAITVVSPPIEIGSVVGSVVDSDENGIGNVEVWADDMVIATTGNDGSFGPVNLLAGTYDFTFVHDDYWTETVDDVEITAGNETTVPEVTMVYPEASVSPSSIEITYNITTGGAVSETFDLSNDGTGPMEYSARVELASRLNSITSDQPREHSVVTNPSTSVKQSERDCGPIQSGAMLDELWDLLFSIDDVSTEFENDYGFGAALHGDYIYVSECQAGEFATYELDGTFVSSQDIPAVMNSTTSTWLGLNDLSSDPDGFLYGTNDDGDIFKFTPDFGTVIEWGQVTESTFDGITIAFDYDNQYAYVSNFGSSFTRVDAEGNTTTLTNCPGSAYGMAYVPGDPDGYTIYAHVDNDTEGIVVRYNPSTDAWESTYIFETFDLSESGLTGGLDAGLSNDGRLDLIALDQDAPDRVKVFEGYPYALQQWLTVSPAEGTIQAGGSQQMTVTVNADNDPEFAYEGGDVVYASIVVAGPHMSDASVVVTINFVVDSATEVDGLPTKYALHQNYPNPFNPTTEIKFDLVQAQNVKLVVFNTLGQEVARLMDAPMQAGYHVVTFDASTFASGVYFYRIETEAFTSMKKMVMVK